VKRAELSLKFMEAVLRDSAVQDKDYEKLIALLKDARTQAKKAKENIDSTAESIKTAADVLQIIEKIVTIAAALAH
jgi:hypothetical protein